ncbi:MAG TPA: PatB family C-S lyase [Candidatus Dormibacteraeota bacterium]|nr:PatB family C-S lyase [Candidatus Dormibacteraeota bacterium]
MKEFLLTETELRAHTGVKWRKYGPDVLPAFVAEMDFKVAPAIQSALKRFIDQEDYGYGQESDLERLYAAFGRWMSRRYGWDPDPALMIATADVVQAVVATVVAYSGTDDGVITQTPIYPPFLRVIASTGRRLVENPLDLGERYTIDLDSLREVAARARVLLLCTPHNPTGRVFDRDELEQIAAIAEEHDLTIVADEIHADVSFPPAKHIPMATIAPTRTVTLTSATKSFNIPGTRAAVVHFGTAELMARFDGAIADHLLGRPSRFGVDATIAAWTDSEEWLATAMRYLESNRDAVTRWAGSRPEVGYRAPEGTFLAWLDFRELNLPGNPYDFFLESAKVALGNGPDFGTPGQGHVRLNFATSAEILQEILARMSHTLDEI